MFINNNAEVFCKGCNDPSFIAQWRFKCNDQNHTGDYLPYSYLGFKTALSHIMSLAMAEAGNPDSELSDPMALTVFLVSIQNTMNEKKHEFSS